VVSLDDRILMNEVYIFDVGRTHVYVRYDNISIYVFIPDPTYCCVGSQTCAIHFCIYRYILIY